jgi:hypothetical protein
MYQKGVKNMIRIPRHWSYYILFIFSVALAFQSDPRLFSFIGISTSFNFLARIGLLIWAIWFFVLGIRGGFIFSSTLNVSYADFPGGYKILWTLFGIGSFLLFLGSLTFS